MKYTIKFIFCLAMFLGIGNKNLRAQVVINYVEPSGYTLRLPDVINFMVLNTGASREFAIGIECKSIESKELVFEAKIARVLFGEKPVQISTTSENFNLVSSNSTYLINNFLKYGKYKICIHLEPLQAAIETSSDCFDFNSMPMNPPMLASPSNGSTINELTPILIWIPPTPILNTRDLRYELKVCKMYFNQSAVEALRTNTPIYQNNSIKGESIQYPFNAQPLEYSEKYAWQVSAFENTTFLGYTEIWMFTPTKDSLETLRQKFSMLSFTRLQLNTGNEVYTTAENFCIQLDEFNIDSAELSVLDASNPKRVVADIGRDDLLVIGDGKVVLNLDSYKAVKPQTRYMLKYKSKQKEYFVNFLFTPEKK